MRFVRSLMFAVLPGLAAPAIASAQRAGPQPSVLVTTTAPRTGSIARTVVGYGVVQTAPGGSRTMSVLRAVEVEQVLVALGQTVRQGQSLMLLGAEPAAIANYKQAASALALALAEHGRLAQMLSQHLATRDQVSQAGKAVSDARANLDVLTNAGGGSVAQTLKAAFDGVVSALPVMPGARVPAQSPLIVLERSDSLVAAVGVEPSLRAQLAVDQAARIEPLDGGTGQDGAVLDVGGMLDPVTHLVAVIVRPADGRGLLPGGAVRVSVHVGETTGWLLPRPSVLTDSRGAYVFQIAGDRALRVDVRIAGMQADQTVVTGKLDPRRSLVSAGNYQLRDGQAVRVNDAATTGAAAIGAAAK